MRAIRMSARHDVPLVVRASVPRTFLGLSVFTETALLVCGGYLLLKALWWPLETGEAAVIASGLLLAMASFLFLYMVRSGVSLALAETDDKEARNELPKLQAPPTTNSVAVEKPEKAAHAAAGH
jgi:type VI protein secretion system component VasK